MKMTAIHSPFRRAFACLIFTLSAASAEVRTFTSPDGRTLQAEITAATPDRVSLKTAAGQPLVVPIDKFIPADQAHIAEWRKANPVQIKYRFVADYTRDGTRARQKETLNGMIIHVNHDGKKVFTWTSSGVPKGAETTAEGTKGSLFGE
jgi:hypothetical protein